MVLRLQVLTQLLLILLVVAFQGCLSKTIMPSITKDAAGLHYPGKFVWFDLYTQDMVPATRFYDAVFNWSFERTNPDSHAVKNILHKGMIIGNFHERAGASYWRCSIATADVHAAYQAALQAGGSDGMPPIEVSDRGLVAMVHDPLGVPFELITSPVGDPRDLPPTDGYWAGGELLTSDVSRSVDFYSHLADYSTHALSLGGREYVLLVAYRRVRAGITSIPPGNLSPLWVPQVSVLDIEGVLQRVKANGGKVLISPQPGFTQGRSALFADPFGAVVGVREFTPLED